MNTLIIFLKYPEPGKVKTRLAKDVGDNVAAKIYSYMAMTIIENVVDPKSYNMIIFYDPPEKEKEIKNWIGKKEVQYSPQVGNTLGDRISNAFKEVYSNGTGKIVIIGTDCLDVTSENIKEAMKKLENCDVTLGPAEDGGYYLVGLNKYTPQIFRDIDWSTDRVLEQTLERIKVKKLNYELLKTLKDIDTFDDLGNNIDNFINTAEA